MVTLGQVASRQIVGSMKITKVKSREEKFYFHYDREPEAKECLKEEYEARQRTRKRDN